MAGQGLNLGIRDVFALINHLTERQELGLDIGLGLNNYTKSAPSTTVQWPCDPRPVLGLENGPHLLAMGHPGRQPLPTT